MFSIQRIESFSEIEDLKREYFSSLRGPQEAWLEEQLHTRETLLFKIFTGIRCIGYYCIDSRNNLLLQFFILKDFVRLSVEAFRFVICESQIGSAYVTTRDPLTLSLCLNFHKKIALESYLFELGKKKKASLEGFDNPEFRVANTQDIEGVVEISGDFFGNVENEVERRRLYLLLCNEDLLGIGYLSTHFCSDKAANLGVFTNPEFRGRNIGSYILMKLVEQCEKRGLAPIAACYHENLDSKGALEKAGFVSIDRTIIATF